MATDRWVGLNVHYIRHTGQTLLNIPVWVPAEPGFAERAKLVGRIIGELTLTLYSDPEE